MDQAPKFVCDKGQAPISVSSMAAVTCDCRTIQIGTVSPHVFKTTFCHKGQAPISASLVTVTAEQFKLEQYHYGKEIVTTL
jgi:hypothetical protein